jgi:pimeloyl-ACP methyl ester carboxylesterase
METRAVTIPINHRTAIAGDLTLPDHPSGIVIFAHGSGSSRRSVRNRAVASALRGAGMATLLLDLLTEDEEFVDRSTREFRFDVDMLARRLRAATDWVGSQADTAELGVGYFGASTGAAAALIAAAGDPRIGAVVSRGGRPDLAGEALADVRAPTLLIVGGDDGVVIDLNRQALQALRCPADMQIVPGAGHLFEEPGALEAVMQLAALWFAQRLGGARPRAAAAASP